jgi:hypothetical protein
MSTLRRCAVLCEFSASMAEGVAVLNTTVTFLGGGSVPHSKLCVVVLAVGLVAGLVRGSRLWWHRRLGVMASGRVILVVVCAGGRLLVVGGAALLVPI